MWRREKNHRLCNARLFGFGPHAFVLTRHAPRFQAGKQIAERTGLRGQFLHSRCRLAAVPFHLTVQPRLAPQQPVEKGTIVLQVMGGGEKLIMAGGDFVS